MKFNMFSRILFAAMMLGVLITGVAVPAAQDDLRDAGRQLAKDYQDAIVTIRITISMEFAFGGNNQKRDIKNEISGTVIGADGLTLVPLSSIDPSQMYKRMMGNEDGDGPKIESQVKDIKLLVGSKRKEVSATVVLRDADLDIAFLRPIEKPAEPMSFINLSDSYKPELLEPVVVLARMGKIADREFGVMSGEIQSIVSKPRTFYVPSAELASGGYGVPIFGANKKVVGIVLMRTMAGGASSGDNDERSLVIIMPAADVQEIAVQAPEKAVAETDEAGSAAPAAPAEKATGKPEDTADQTDDQADKKVPATTAATE